MSLLTWVQEKAVRLALLNKEKLLAFFLRFLDQEYTENRSKIAAGVVKYLPKSWKLNATNSQMERFLDITKKYISDSYSIIQEMKDPLVGP